MVEVIRNPPSTPDGHGASQYLDGRRAAPQLPPRDA
jgi:hypothetical protein